MNKSFKRLLLSGFFMLSALTAINGQNNDDIQTESYFRVNFFNPALEYELKTGSYSALSTAVGIGYGGSFPDLEVTSANGFVYIISPFIDIQQKWYYNREKRFSQEKTIDYNAGNFISLRGIARFSPISENVTRTDDTDFGIGPTWGLQRAYNKWHFLFDVGPQFYFDTEGNSGFFPVIIQVNIGLNLSKKR